MCQSCDGVSEEEIERGIDISIEVYGFFIQMVRGPGDPEWTYTVGLNEQFDHPDLLCVQVKAELQERLTSFIGQAIVEGSGSFNPDDLEGLDVELVPIHPRHLRQDLVATWVDRYMRFPVSGDFLQIVPGPSWFCSCHASQVQRLDSPKPMDLGRSSGRVS